MNNDNLYKMAEGRNLLASFAMINMQVDAWIKKAEEHLKDLGLKDVEGILLGEADILSRSSFNKPMASGDDDETMLQNFITAIRNQFPLVINNQYVEYADIGFATAGGKVLAKLAPVMFRSAQLAKKGCQWQLVGTEHCAVWLTVGGTFVAPLPMDVGLHVLKAFNKCDPAVFSSGISDEEKREMIRCMKARREELREGHLIKPIDEDEEDLKRKAL